MKKDSVLPLLCLLCENICDVDDVACDFWKVAGCSFPQQSRATIAHFEASKTGSRNIGWNGRNLWQFYRLQLDMICII